MFDSSTCSLPSIPTPHAVEAPPNMWSLQRSVCKRDLIIKAIVIGIFVALGAAASVCALMGVAAGIPLGNIGLGLFGAIVTLSLHTGVEKGQLFGRGKAFFDLRFYHQPKVAARVCDDLKTESFEKIARYSPDNLCRYGFITPPAAEKMKHLSKMVDFLDKSDQDWNWDHIRELRLYQKDPEAHPSEKVKERQEVMKLKDEVIELKWQQIRNLLILPNLPEKLDS
jgi:hypothetical protein